jgi:hypothetical protein
VIVAHVFGGNYVFYSVASVRDCTHVEQVNCVSGVRDFFANPDGRAV